VYYTAIREHARQHSLVHYTAIKEQGRQHSYVHYTAIREHDRQYSLVETLCSLKITRAWKASVRLSESIADNIRWCTTRPSGNTAVFKMTTYQPHQRAAYYRTRIGRQVSSNPQQISLLISLALGTST